jgi:hypothetical protein
VRRSFLGDLNLFELDLNLVDLNFAEQHGGLPFA